MLLILFLLISEISMVMTISICQSDMDKDKRPRVSCVNQGLTAMPEGIDPGTQTLVLNQNAFVSLSSSAYTTFTHLHELDLSQNMISTIKQSGPVLENLRVLRLSNNKLTALGRATFISTPSLMEIYLDGNVISSLDNATFSDLPLIEIINLSGNKLHVLPPYLLEHISSRTLKNFDLEDNNIKHLPDGFFTSKPDIPYVFLSKNPWVCDCRVSYLHHYLDDQGHNIYLHTGPSSITNNPESVVCSAPSSLQGQAIVDLTSEDYCSSDAQLSASTTALTEIIIHSKIITTDLPTTAPTTIQPTTPKPTESSTTSITTTRTAINGCQSDRDKDNRPRVSCVNQGLSQVPDGINPGTQTLNLSQNAFGFLSSAAYTNFTHLHELDLSQNLISTINQSGPVLENLRVLRLSNNKLTALGRATFISTPSLMEIYLDRNAISFIDDTTFSDLPFLEIINLSGNKLHILPPYLLEHISSRTLKNFDLEENNIEHLPDGFFASKPDIPYVFLSKNPWVCDCRVSYLWHYLSDQSHNIYLHTGPSSITNNPESVVCSAPHQLQEKVIVDLTSKEYCSSDDDFQISTVHTTQQKNALNTTLTEINVNAKVITTVYPTTAPTTIQPTTPKPTESSTTSITTTLTAINACQSDRDKDNRPRVSCVNQGLTAVPEGINPGTQTLNLSQNIFGSLSSAAYTNFTHLHELDLSQNMISTIDQSGPVLENLRVLRLTNNKLTTLAPATFKSTPFLMEIYLDGNTINSLDNATFSDLPLVEIINLSGNKLHILPPFLLENISSRTFKTFDLEDNNIEHLPDGFFASKPDLPHVFLSKNPWVCTCQVSYLQRYLDNHRHNVYIHTGQFSIINDPKSVVCSAPSSLEKKAVVDLKKEYCRLDHESKTIKPVTPMSWSEGAVSARGGGQRSVPWCWWLFITVLVLCIFSAIFSCMLFLWLIITYITLYQPLKRQIHTSQEVTLRAYQVAVDDSLIVDNTEDERVLFLPPEMIRETQPVFRSVLYISKGDEDSELNVKTELNGEKEKKTGSDAVAEIVLVPSVTHIEQETETKDRQEVFRKTLYRVISREEEIEGWNEVEQNFWRMMARDKRKDDGGGDRRKTRYSLILREERGSVMEGRKGETEWLVGEWEMRGGIPGDRESLIRMKERPGLSNSACNDTPEYVAETPV